MPIVKFSENWNGKLNNKAFTTFRPHSPNHYKVGKIFTVSVAGRPFCNAKVLAIKTLKLNDITEFEARLDTGFSKLHFINTVKKMYKSRAFFYDKQLFDLILFERLDSQQAMKYE